MDRGNMLTFFRGNIIKYFRERLGERNLKFQTRGNSITHVKLKKVFNLEPVGRKNR